MLSSKPLSPASMKMKGTQAFGKPTYPQILTLPLPNGPMVLREAAACTVCCSGAAQRLIPAAPARLGDVPNQTYTADRYKEFESTKKASEDSDTAVSSKITL